MSTDEVSDESDNVEVTTETETATSSEESSD
jgi:hypothetical protein